MKPSEIMDLDTQSRIDLWRHVTKVIESYITTVHQSQVASELNPEKIRFLLNSMQFTDSLAPKDAVDFVVQGLWDHQVHTPHPCYFGLFNPAPTTMGIAADTLAAAFNPQLAAWSHSPFANEVEQHLIRIFGSQFGYDVTTTAGTFTSGGTEANLTALLTALSETFPEFAERGVRGLVGQPTLYTSAECHHSIIRAARTCGLGSDAVRLIPIDQSLQMDVKMLREQIASDSNAGYTPFLIVATAGTTNAGMVDPIARLADVASSANVWLHVDAAWGGAAVFVPELRSALEGIERADSITFDAHKWLSVPMGAGLYVTRHPDILRRTFSISTGYMPTDAHGLNVIDPYMHSIQWSRRFIGLKIFLSLAVVGWDGYRAVIKHQVSMGDLLRRKLEEDGWRIVNKTKLPVVCFINDQDRDREPSRFIETVAKKVVSSGKAWISTTYLNKDVAVLRACITNYRTESEHISALTTILRRVRSEILH
ncbi:MAG: pyridoxal phosphate-dependent decarboxylase family protein [Candidatus Hodarchaeota archaeon]